MRLSRFLAVATAVALSACLAGCQGGCAAKPVPAPVPVPPTPQPGPGPMPDPAPPGPPPAPVAAVAGFVIVEDTSAAGQARGMFLSSVKVSAFLKNSGLAHAIVSTAAIDPSGNPVGGVLGALIADAKGKGLPRLYQLDSKGKTVRDLACPLDPDAFVQAFAPPPHARSMGMQISKPKLKWAVYGSTPSTPMIPRAQWKKADLGAYLPPVHDQDGRGQCNASATCTALETAREIAGHSYVYLSAGDLYSQINGGSDNGSTLEDGLAAALSTGVATSSTVPYVWDGRNHGSDSKVKSERKNYRAVECYLCPSFDHMASALQQGFVIVEGLVWCSNFNPDADGWLPARPGRQVGGHALCGYGLDQRNGVWGIKTRNSWGVTWGLGGDCVIPESLFDGQVSGYWAVRSVVRTPEPFPPSAPGARKVRLELNPEFTLAP